MKMPISRATIIRMRRRRMIHLYRLQMMYLRVLKGDVNHKKEVAGRLKKKIKRNKWIHKIQLGLLWSWIFFWFWLANFGWVIWYETILPNVEGAPVHKSYLKKQTNKQNKNKNKIKQLFYHIDLLYSAKRKTIKGTESLEIACLGIHWIFKCYKNDLKKIWRCTWPKIHRKNTDKALAYSYSDIRSYEREQKCLTFSITITLNLLWFLQDGVLVWIFPSLSGGFRLCFPSSKHLNSHLHFSLRLK